MSAWPTIEEERAMAFCGNVPACRRLPQFTSPWRSVSTAVAIVFFVLTLGAMASADRLFHLLSLPAGWVTAAASLLIAELLIRRTRMWGTGVESALWIGGLLAFIFSLPSSGKPEAILVFAAAAAISGWRVRNPLFGSAAVVLVTAYFAARQWPWSAMFFGLAVGVVALVMLTREWRRPSTEVFWNVLAVVMPITAYVAGTASNELKSDARVVALFSAYAIGALFVAITARVRGALMVTAVALSIAIVAATDFIPLSFETELIVLGLIALAVAGGIARALRGKTKGFVLAKTDRTQGLETVLSVAPAILTAHQSTPSEPKPVSGGGEFGGAGTSGQY